MSVRCMSFSRKLRITFTVSLLFYPFPLSSELKVGNKRDLEPHEVTDDIVELFIEQFPRFNGYFKISCKNNIGVDEMITEISRILSASSYSFKETFDAFTLHGQHISGECCSNPDHNQDPDAHPRSGSATSCCAK